MSKRAIVLLICCLAIWCSGCKEVHTACDPNEGHNGITTNTYNTIARLPNDQLIWPVPQIKTSRVVFSVEARFVESKEILSTTKGQWIESTYLIKYEVIKSDAKYPHKNIVFIANDIWPTKESGIMVKKLAWPFVNRKENMLFYLKRSGGGKPKTCFEILAYHAIDVSRENLRGQEH